jgi:hypothetical protein
MPSVSVCCVLPEYINNASTSSIIWTITWTCKVVDS